MEKGKRFQFKKKCAYNSVQQESEDTNERFKMSKEEKKARRILSQLNVIPILGVKRVAMRRSDNTQVIIDDPEVYRPANSDTYIVFGIPRCQEPLEQAQQTAAERFKFEDFLRKSIQSSESSTDIDESDDGDDGLGVDNTDIDIIIAQCKVSRKKAIRAYKEHNYDLVNAIMHLTR